MMRNGKRPYVRAEVTFLPGRDNDILPTAADLTESRQLSAVVRNALRLLPHVIAMTSKLDALSAKVDSLLLEIASLSALVGQGTLSSLPTRQGKEDASTAQKLDALL